MNERSDHIHTKVDISTFMDKRDKIYSIAQYAFFSGAFGVISSSGIFFYSSISTYNYPLSLVEELEHAQEQTVLIDDSHLQSIVRENYIRQIEALKENPEYDLLLREREFGKSMSDLVLYLGFFAIGCSVVLGATGYIKSKQIDKQNRLEIKQIK